MIIMVTANAGHNITNLIIVTVRVIFKGLFYNVSGVPHYPSEVLIIVNGVFYVVYFVMYGYILITFTVEYLTMAIALRKSMKMQLMSEGERKCIFLIKWTSLCWYAVLCVFGVT